MAPLVSIGIPTYNRADLLAQSIKSVLQQSFEDFELIISDDSSPDQTAEVVRSFKDPRIIYHHPQQRLHVPRNWNECVRLARGEFFALLPDDDVYCPDFLKVMVATIREAPNVGFIQCGVHQVDQQLRSIRPRLAGSTQIALQGEDAIFWQMPSLFCWPAALFFRRAAMLQMGLWREDYWDDWAFIVKLAFRYGFVYIPQLLSCVRFHDQNLSIQIVQEGFDNLANISNQQLDVFGAALPASPKLISFRAERDRWLSNLYMIAVVRSLQRLDIRRALSLFSLARSHDAFAGLNLGFIPLALKNRIEKNKEMKRILESEKGKPIVELV